MWLILWSIEVESHVDDTWEQHLCSYMERCWTLSSGRSKPRRMASFLCSCRYIRSRVCFHYIFFSRMSVFVQETFLLISVFILCVLLGSKRLFLLMLVMFLELKTMVLLRNGIPSSGKRSITSPGQAVSVILRRLFLSPLQRLMLISLDLRGKRTRLSSTEGLSRPRAYGVWKRMTLRSHSHGLTVVSACVIAYSSVIDQVISTRASGVVTGLVITQEGLVITLDQAIITLGRAIILGLVMFPGGAPRTMITAQGILQAHSWIHRGHVLVLHRLKTVTESRGTHRSTVWSQVNRWLVSF